MTTNDPEVQAILVTCKSKDDGTVLVRAVRLVENHDPSCVNDDWEYESLIRLSDYEAMKAEYEEELFQVRQTRDSHFGSLAKSIEQVVALQDECDQLRKDAERYRRLRDGNNEKNSKVKSYLRLLTCYLKKKIFKSS